MEKTIKITMMDRSGHREVEVDFDGAVDLCKQELSKGKWLRVITNDGKDYVVQQLEVFEKELESIKADILNGVDITLMAGLKGGNCGAGFGSCLANGSAPAQAAGSASSGAGKYCYDSEGYDANGFDSEGYDREGFNAAGLDSEGYNRNGYDKDGYDRDGLDADGNEKVEPKAEITVKIVKDPDSLSVICVKTDGTVICNNAHGKEVFAEGAARLLLALQRSIPEMMRGEAKVVDKQG